MRAGLTRQALRRHRWSFLGPAATQSAAALVLSAMIMTRTSLGSAPPAADVQSATEVFIGIAMYLSMLMVGVTMNSAIARQGRDLALLRAVGATPGRLRRSVAAQAAAVAVPASVLGYLLGLVAGWLWVGALVGHGVAPPAVRFTPTLGFVPLVVGIVVGTSILGGLVAAIRPTRIRPAAALTEIATGRPGGTARRLVLGLIMVTGGVLLSAVISAISPRQADDLGFFVMLAMCVGVGMLGPVILGVVARAARPVLRRAGGCAELAVDNLTALSRALSGALVPLVLSIAFATVKIAAHTTAAHTTGVTNPGPALWLDYSGTAIYTAFAAIAALNTLLTVVVGRRWDLAVMRLAGATRQRVAAVVAWEAGLVLVTALALAAVVAGVTLVPLLQSSLHTWVPYLPVPYVVAGVLLAAALVAAGTIVPAAVLTRRPPIEVAGAGT